MKEQPSPALPQRSIRHARERLPAELGRIIALELMANLVSYYRRYRLMGGDGRKASKEQARV